MEPDDLKSAWQALDARLARQEYLQLALLREDRFDQARKGMRPLYIGQSLQLLLGTGLIVLGVACWTGNLHAPSLLAAGLVLHAFGILTAAMAGLTMGLAATIDYSAPVMLIQKQTARLLRFHTLNSNLCGLPWWIMWVLVVVGFAGLGRTDPSASATAWVTISLGIGVCGLLATWAWIAWRSRAGDAQDPLRERCDGADGIRRAKRLLDDIARFEQD